MTDSERRVSKLPLLIMGGVVAVSILVVIALVAARANTSYEPGTPEAALQQFLTAVLDDDREATLAMLVPEVRAACEREIDGGPGFSGDDLLAELDEIEVTGDSARATVRFRSDSGDPFDNSSWDFDHRYTLRQVQGEWRIESAGWPYPLGRCTPANS
jgi:hypothetical protein